jgi:hypothetical protein
MVPNLTPKQIESHVEGVTDDYFCLIDRRVIRAYSKTPASLNVK